MTYDYISSILRKLTATSSEEELTPKATSVGSLSSETVKSIYFQTLEDELVELNETSETDYKEMLSDSTTVEDIEKEIEAKQQEIIDKQAETEAYIETCQNAIQTIFANGTDIIPKEVQEKYDDELAKIISNITTNTGVIQENLSVVTENTITMKLAEAEIETKEKEIEQKEKEIESLRKEENPNENEIQKLQNEINGLNLEIANLQTVISNATKNIQQAESENNSLQTENSNLSESQKGLMNSLMDEYYETHTEEDRVYEDSGLRSQIENLESNIQDAQNNLTINTIKLSSDIELLAQIKGLKEQMSAASSTTGTTTPKYSTGGTTYTGNLPTNQTLASAAESMASSMGTTGWCLKGVNNTLEQVYGFRLSYNSAYQAIPDLQSRSDFVEVTNQYKSASDLVNLPAGAIVVWENSSNHPHGHISIALGDGREASDHIQNQTVNYGTQYHVFIKNG